MASRVQILTLWDDTDAEVVATDQVGDAGTDAYVSSGASVALDFDRAVVRVDGGRQKVVEALKKFERTYIDANPSIE